MRFLAIATTRLALSTAAALAMALIGLVTYPASSTAQDKAAVQAPDATAQAPPSKPRDAQVEGRAQQNVLIWFAQTSGLIGLVILLLSIYFVSTVGRLFIEMRPKVAAPPETIEECEELLSKRQFKDVFALTKEDTSLFSRVVSAGIAELPNGLAEARDAMERVGDALMVEMEKKISMLAVLGTLGPMIGLLGTLKGMIASFSVIARSDASLNASDVARGISEALLLTFEGVALSVPAIYFFAFFRNRISMISASTMLQADEFLRRFSHAARSKAPAPGAPPTVAAPTPAAKSG